MMYYVLCMITCLCVLFVRNSACVHRGAVKSIVSAIGDARIMMITMFVYFIM